MLFFKLTCIEKIKINCNHHIRSLELHVNKKRNNPKTKAGTSGKKGLEVPPVLNKMECKNNHYDNIIVEIKFQLKND